jgi:hypothetical protein
MNAATTTKSARTRVRARLVAGAFVALCALGAAFAWHRHAGEQRADGGARDASRGAAADAGPRLPESEVHTLDPLVPPRATAVPGKVTLEPALDGGPARVLRWELEFPRGVWSLRFELGSPEVELRFLDVSGTISADCHALEARTERGPAPFPEAIFDADAHTATLADMPLEVVEALARARELTLVACDTTFTLDDTQQRVLIDFYVQAAGLILDAVAAPPDGGVVEP